MALCELCETNRGEGWCGTCASLLNARNTKMDKGKGKKMSVSSDTSEAMRAVEDAWDKCQSICEHRNPNRDDEGQGRICEHPENTSGMEWCDPSHCPLLSLS